VRWSAVSDDGHVVQGVIAFGRRPRPAAAGAHAPLSTVEGRVRDRALGAGSLLRGAARRLGTCAVRSARLAAAREERSANGVGSRSPRSDGSCPRTVSIHASHGGASTRFGPGDIHRLRSRGHRRRCGGDRGHRPIGGAVRGRARGRRLAGADRCGACARSGAVVARECPSISSTSSRLPSGSAASSRLRSSRRARAYRRRLSARLHAASRAWRSRR
jgi:hypothetical protein